MPATKSCRSRAGYATKHGGAGGPLVNGRRKPKPKLRQTALGIVLLLVGIAAGDALRFIDLRLVQAVRTAIVADDSGSC